jgi:hypothetical protein
MIVYVLLPKSRLKTFPVAERLESKNMERSEKSRHNMSVTE